MRAASLILLLVIAGYAFATHSEGSEEITSEDADADVPSPRSNALMLSREEKIQKMEVALDRVRREDLGPLLRELSAAQHQHNELKRSMPWFPSEADKRSLAASEQQLNRARAAVVRVQEKEMQLVNQLKPLYGLVSYEFVQEQQVTISSSIQKVNTLAYDNAWWTSLFDLSRAESLSDVIIGFFVQWLLNYVIMYPFALAYYAFWSLPWSIYAYSSSTSDLVVGALTWGFYVVLMASPLLALAGGVYAIRRYAGDDIMRWLQNRRVERARRRGW